MGVLLGPPVLNGNRYRVLVNGDRIFPAMLAAIRAAKEAIDSGLEVDLQHGLEIERMLFASVFATRDRATGMASFIEKGPGKASFEGA